MRGFGPAAWSGRSPRDRGSNPRPATTPPLQPVIAGNINPGPYCNLLGCAGRAEGLALPRNPKPGVMRGPVTRHRGQGLLARAHAPPMTSAPWGRGWRGARRRAGSYRLCRGNLARPGREQPNPGPRRSRVNGATGTGMGDPQRVLVPRWRGPRTPRRCDTYYYHGVDNFTRR